MHNLVLQLLPQIRKIARTFLKSGIAMLWYIWAMNGEICCMLKAFNMRLLL
jgi:hypothetical protein